MARRIDDHAFWAGKGSRGSIFPEGAKIKEIPSMDDEPSAMRYEDTEEMIHAAQDDTVKDMNKEPMKSGYRY